MIRVLRRAGGFTLSVGLAAILTWTAANAQQAPVWEVSAFGGRIGAVSSPATGALLTPNQPGSPSPSVPFFNVTLSEDSHLIFGGRVGRYLTPRIAVEGAFTLGTPAITAMISNDAGGAANQALPYANGREWSIDGGLLFEQPLAGGWIRPFAVASVGALRQTIADSEQTLGGQLYRLGGGAKFVVARPGPHAKDRAGIRADVLDAIRTRVFDPSANPRAHHSLMVVVSAFLAF